MPPNQIEKEKILVSHWEWLNPCATPMPVTGVALTRFIKQNRYRER
jgi:hypothetical protein